MDICAKGWNTRVHELPIGRVVFYHVYVGKHFFVSIVAIIIQLFDIHKAHELVPREKGRGHERIKLEIEKVSDSKLSFCRKRYPNHENTFNR
jgi:hypothetical protein